MGNQVQEIATTLQSDEEAATRFAKYEWKDPYPKVPPALLNSADIHAYVEKTGALFPYYPDKLKGSSLGLHVGSKAATFDPDTSSMNYIDLSAEGATVTLAENSLVYIETEETIRLPHYLAMRFNLQIHLVHSGLLLGTGPLVDPGYRGKLLIPVHNFTNRPLPLKRGDRFIWAEFTKVSPHPSWCNIDSPHGHEKAFKAFEKNMLSKHPRDFIRRVAPLEDLYTAIPVALKKSENTIENHEKTVNRFQRLGSVAGAALVITVLGITASTYSVVQDANNANNTATRTIEEFKNSIRFSENSTTTRLKILELRSGIEVLRNSTILNYEDFAARQNNWHSEQKQTWDELKIQLEDLSTRLADLESSLADAEDSP